MNHLTCIPILFQESRTLASRERATCATPAATSDAKSPPPPFERPQLGGDHAAVVRFTYRAGSTQLVDNQPAAHGSTARPSFSRSSSTRSTRHHGSTSSQATPPYIFGSNRLRPSRTPRRARHSRAPQRDARGPASGGGTDCAVAPSRFEYKVGKPVNQAGPIVRTGQITPCEIATASLSSLRSKVARRQRNRCAHWPAIASRQQFCSAQCPPAGQTTRSAKLART